MRNRIDDRFKFNHISNYINNESCKQRQRSSGWIEKQDPTKCCLQKTDFKFKHTGKLRGWGENSMKTPKLYQDITGK